MEAFFQERSFTFIFNRILSIKENSVSYVETIAQHLLSKEKLQARISVWRHLGRHIFIVDPCSVIKVREDVVVAHVLQEFHLSLSLFWVVTHNLSMVELGAAFCREFHSHPGTRGDPEKEQLATNCSQCSDLAK